MKVSVFIDGFNLFYCLKAAKFKWLNLPALCDSLAVRGRFVHNIHYFTAMVDGVGDANRPKRQQDYLKAIETDSRVKVHKGTFLKKTVVGPVERLMLPDSTITSSTPPTLLAKGLHAVADTYGKTRNLSVYNKKDIFTPKSGPPSFAIVQTREEKGSDVNLASHLLLSAFRGEYDQAIVVTNDSDLCEPVRIVKEELNKEVTVCYVPQDKNKNYKSTQLHKAASGTLHVNWAQLRKYPFPAHITLGDGSVVSKPAEW